MSVSEADLLLMRHIEALRLNFPFAGARTARYAQAGRPCGGLQARACTLRNKMVIAAIHRKRNTSAPHRSIRTVEASDD